MEDYRVFIGLYLLMLPDAVAVVDVVVDVVSRMLAIFDILLLLPVKNTAPSLSSSSLSTKLKHRSKNK